MRKTLPQPTRFIIIINIVFRFVSLMDKTREEKGEDTALHLFSGWKKKIMALDQSEMLTVCVCFLNVILWTHWRRWSQVQFR